jgi:uncharacterized protein (DUF736 family)
MMIGTFHYDRRGDSYTGDISTLALQRSHVEFRRNSDKRGDKEPDYRIVQDGPDGTAELGAAWKQRSNAGNDYLSVVLDDPSLPQPVHAALMLPERDGPAMLVWSRPARRNARPQNDRSPR